MRAHSVKFVTSGEIAHSVRSILYSTPTVVVVIARYTVAKVAALAKVSKTAS